MSIFKLKTRYLAVLFACGFFLSAGYELWNYSANYREDRATEALIQDVPRNLNSIAIRKALSGLREKAALDST